VIRALRVEGFKRFVDRTFAFAPLTVLTGLNGSGKTSVIHALLLMREASQALGVDPIVPLNGPYDLELGSAEDVRNWDFDEARKIRFTTTAEDGRLETWVFSAPGDEALHLRVEERPIPPPLVFGAAHRTFDYLSAERFGPRSTLGATALPVDRIEVGTRGEYTAQVLAALGSKPLEWKDRRHPKADPNVVPFLKYEVEQWLAEIARPVELEATTFPGTTVTSLRFRVPGKTLVRAPNMGFGVTYSLPVVVAALLIRPGGLLIVENPEAHLHPAGQSAMGGFLTRIAAAGVQVLLETHSDHVLNGVRRAIGEQHVLPAKDAVVHFFDAKDAEPQTLTVTETGGISHWPRGFFDQYQLDVAALTRVRRPR
jgi:predicted ATPase